MHWLERVGEPKVDNIYKWIIYIYIYIYDKKVFVQLKETHYIHLYPVWSDITTHKGMDHYRYWLEREVLHTIYLV